uniref:protochlorophyllide reductase n=2 Tax=Phaeocystis antarctica TaxID=33657 RepID=A0A7S0HVC1_9EUKA|mmetsp:Transcript_34751/g.82040  ORF Transcript_34751/g.82040 Transcript_34751/m.82040 type:complete len:558 (+) Transcript_34751:38-1711(+)
MAMSRLLVVASLLNVASGFKFLSNFKMPSLQDKLNAQKADAKFGTKKLVVVTGTSSGLGRKTARALLRTGRYHVVGAVRDMDKMEAVAEIEGFDEKDFTAMQIELNSFDSVRQFCDELKVMKMGRPLDRLICNAAVYQPSLPYAKWSVDGHEQQMQINYLSHFLMVSLLLDDIAAAPDPRVVLVGSVTGNDNTVGGGGVYPIADLKDLKGLKAGASNPISMFDGYNFDGAKAYKDSKLCLMMTSNLLHDKYNKQTGIAFSSIYPGCIAESPLFREKRPWFRKYFPIFMKYITGGFVGEEEAGMRLFQVAHDPRCSKSGVYWSWNGGPREGREDQLDTDGQISGGGGAGGGWDSIYENDQSDKVLNAETSANLWKYSTQVTGAQWPAANQPKSPCPTLVVVGSITSMMNAKQEAKRFTPAPGNVGAGAAGTVAGVAGTVLDTAVGGTLGAGLKFAQAKLLGDVPDEAKEGSFQEDLSVQSESGGKRKRVKAVWRKIFRKAEGPTAEQLAEAKAAEQAEEAAAIAEILEREKQEDLLALKVEAALASGLKVSAKEDVSA